MRIRTTSLASIFILVIVAGGTALAHDHDRGRRAGQQQDHGRDHGDDGQNRPSAEPSPSPHPSAQQEEEAASSDQPSSGSGEGASNASPAPATPPPSTEPVEPSPATHTPLVHVDIRASSILAQIGTSIRYSVLVQNRSREAASDLSVTQIVAEELEVLAVPSVNGVTKQEISDGGIQKKIVWSLAPLAAGSSVVLEWTGRAVAPGDLEALNTVIAETLQGPVVEASQITFLAVANPPREEDEVLPKIVERVVTTRLVPVTQPVQGGLLPFTGPPSELVVLGGAGFIMIFAGIALMTRRRAIRLGIGICTLALVTTACVSSTEDRQSAAPTSSPRATAPDAREEPDEEPRVKGKRIFRNGTDAEDADQQPVTQESIEQPEGQAPATSWREVTVVTFRSKVPDTVRLTDLEADNFLSYLWERDEGIVQATSSARITEGAIATLFTSVSEKGDGLQASATLTNVTEDERLEVSGHIVFSILRDGEVVGELTSQRIETILNPNGETTASFEYALPDGNYSGVARFEAD